MSAPSASSGAAARLRPPFRADHVGSLLRPQALAEARAQLKRGELEASALRELEDAAILEAIARQESLGLQSVSDGELRREYWHIDFLKQLQGVAIRAMEGPRFEGSEEQPPVATVVGKVGCESPIMLEDFRFLAAHTQGTAKFTIPSPSMLHLRLGRQGISCSAYPRLEPFWADVAAAYRTVIASFAAAGCRYLQLDDVAFAYLGDPAFRERCRINGDDPRELPERYAATINAALRDRPADMAVTIHTCHGNFRSRAATHGGYEEIAAALFSCEVDGFFMEFDGTEPRSFEPLQRLPRGKKVVLGLVTTKFGRVESKDALRRSIEEATRYVPLESLCISPQCGFASTFHGNELSQEEQWRKLALVVEVATEVWGSAA